ALNGIFSMTEVALISARKSRLTSDAKEGSRSASKALELANDPERFLSTVQIGITLIGILTGLFSGAAFSRDVSEYMEGWGISPKYAHSIAQASIVVVVTYLSIVVGELVPKRIGMSRAEGISILMARPMWFMSKMALPAVWLLSKSTQLITRIIGIEDHTAHVTEEEIKSLIQDGTTAGEVRPVEQDIMERALVMGDLRVSSIMTPASEVDMLEPGMGIEAIRNIVDTKPHNTYPVRDDDRSPDVIGVVSLKDLVLELGEDGFDLSGAIKPCVYIPECMTVYDALELLRSRRLHCAFVCDEYGLFQGIVTLLDILEGLIGTIPATREYDDIVPQDDGMSWLIDGQTPVYDFFSYFDMEDRYEPSHYATLGGLILEHAKYIPTIGEHIKWDRLDFEIINMDGARIDKILLKFQADNK
ncbi:MAG: hemolysin family protein, partial [Muribaculaceae bacterium]|nr:hemolysin family protein [Muribaculaceae bacterium]